MIDGPWGQPRIYPEMQGILDNPDSRLCQAEGDGQGLFGQNGAGLGAAIGSLLGGGTGRAAPARTGRGPADSQPKGGPLGGPLGETIGNLLQQGLSGFGGRGRSRHRRLGTDRSARAVSAASRPILPPAAGAASRTGRARGSPRRRAEPTARRRTASR